MVTLTIKNIPESLVKRLKQQAAAHRQSVRLDVISYLEQMTDRGGSGWLDSVAHSLSGAWRIADYAAVCRVVRLSQYTWSGVWPSSARCGRVWL